MLNFNTPIDYEKRNFQKVRLAVQNQYSLEMIRDLELEFFTRDEIGKLLFTLNGYIWKEIFNPIQIVSHPATWFDAFKEKYFPEWLKKRFPVKYASIWFQPKFLRPDLAMSVDKFIENVEFMVFKVEGETKGRSFSWKPDFVRHTKIVPKAY